MSNVLMISAIAMLVLLFLKVPVFIAVLGGSMVYFVMNPVLKKFLLWRSHSSYVPVFS